MSSPTEISKSSKWFLTIKKWLTTVTMAGFFLAGGIEYSVILPTCWDYMHKQFGAEKWLYGLTIAAMSISNMIVGPIMGTIYDRTHCTKAIVLFLNLFEIGGNIMYFAATSKYMVLGSRFIVGVGVSAGSVLFGEIARTSTKKQRTSSFAFFMSTRQIGLVIGPAFNLFLRICGFNIGPFEVNKWTSPAIFMTLVWITLELMFLFLFFHLPTADDMIANDSSSDLSDNKSESKSQTCIPEKVDDEKNVSVSISESLLHRNLNLETATVSVDENEPILRVDSNHKDGLVETCQLRKDYGSINVPEGNKVSSPTVNVNTMQTKGVIGKVQFVLSEFITEQVTLLLGLLFITLFNQLVLETGFVPLVQEIFDWTELEISLFYSGAGILLLISFAIVSICTKKLTDRWLIVIGLTCILISYVWFVVFIASGKTSSWSLAQFIIGAALGIFALPFVFVSSTSLYSKILSPTIQGFGQGIRRSVAAVASIMGPLWAGASFELYYWFQYYPFFTVPLLLVVIIIVLVMLSFRKLISSTQKSTERTAKEIQKK